MSEWQVALEMSEGSSNKFWRARVEGKTLYVNYGRIGTGGQTQVKELASADAAKAELEKLEREKRKKGYEDEAPRAGGVRDEDEGDTIDEDVEEEDDEDEDEAPAPRKSAAPKLAVVPSAASYKLQSGGRNIELTMTLEGKSVRTVVVETYDSPEAAKAAYSRIDTAIETEGYRRS